MVFLITRSIHRGNVTLRRESALAAMKKATELISDGLLGRRGHYA